LSLNLAANPASQHSLQTADFIFAVVVHIVVIAMIVTLTWWQSISKPEPLKRIEVTMISGADLAKLQKKISLKPKKSKAKPVVKFDPVAAKKTQVKEVEDDFDPFAPMESQSDITTPKQATRNDMADIMGKQLSEKELDRYIAMMQQAVQRKWKVPAGVDSSIPDPLVEMVLRRNGTVFSATIVESSGNSALDQTLIKAIHAAAPFKLPQQQFEAFRVNQIRFRPLK